MSRQLDAAIAEALGKQIYTWSKITDTGMRWGNSLLHYSTDGNAMLELDREMRERSYYCLFHGQIMYDKDAPICNHHAEYRRAYTTDMDEFTVADTEPLARALAAYKALTGKEWKEGE